MYLILAGFLHFIEEVEYFGEKVLPLVRELELEADRRQQQQPQAGSPAGTAREPAEAVAA